MTEDPRASSRRHSRFVSKLGHELRTPLGSVLMMAELLGENSPGNLTEKQIGYARKIHRAASEMRALLDETSTLAKIEGGRQDVYRAEVALADLARWIEERPAAGEGAGVTVELADGLPSSIETDRSYLERILAALIDCIAGSSGGGAVAVRVSSSDRRDGAVAFTVAGASGAAIPEDRWQEIFDPFSQAGRCTRRRGGSGHSLELPIARGLAGLLGGDLVAESAGFVLYLP